MLAWDASDEDRYAETEPMMVLDKSRGRDQGLKQFLEDKTYRPGLGADQR